MGRNRKWKTEWNKRDTHHTNRQLYIRDGGACRDTPQLSVRADGTVVVDVDDLYRVVEHTGEIDEETGLERIEIVEELVTLKDAQQTTQFRNERGWGKGWLEILIYDEVYRRENGELIDGVRPRKTGPTAKRMRAAQKKLRIAKVG